MEIQSHLKIFLSRHEINCHIGIGFSGGVDSTLLAFLISTVYPLEKITLLYLNHHLREDSDQEEKHVRAFADSRNLKLEIVHLDFPDKSNIEEKARLQRYAFFNTWADENSAVVFTAHHKDDQVETLLYRIFRGTGLNGLLGIREKFNSVYRPLLNYSRTELEKIGRDNSLNWYSDISNDDTRFRRNALRHNIIPLIEDHFGEKSGDNVLKLKHSLADYFENREKILDYLQEIKIVNYHSDQFVLEKSLIYLYFPTFIKFIVETAFRCVFQKELVVSGDKWQELLELFYESEGKTQLSDHIDVIVGEKKIWFRSNRIVDPLVIKTGDQRSGELEWLDWIIKWQFADLFEPELSTEKQIQIDAGELKEASFVVKSAASGETLIKANNTFSSNVQKVYSDLKIEKAERSRMPVIYDGNEIVGGLFLGAAENYKITSETNEILVFEFIEKKANGKNIKT